ncbi:MAG: SMP-30/gluconolactonase/LRE family protein [Gammaproteobacteria bacterium]|nr:SMP-30/gluconolactonase/LRE family protein [Gammaproteobacteria bacterium]
MNMKSLAAAMTAAALAAACTEEPPPSPAVESEPAAEAPEPAAPAEPAGQPADSAAGGGDMPDEIVAERGGFIPEGIEYDTSNQRFLVGSLAEGTIFEVANDGTLTPVVEDPELVSSVGIEVDEERDRLLVANSDSSVFQGGGPGQAKLGIYDLMSGEQIAMADLAAALQDAPEDASYFANDVAVGDDGTAYVTDTMMNVIYEVGEDQQASVLYRFEDGPGLNGIVFHPDGYLLVVGGAALYKVPVDDPESMSEVMLEQPIEGADGMVLTEDGRLVVVSNSTSSVGALTSDDDWASAQAAGTAMFEGQATTAAIVGDDIYVVKPHFNDQEPPSIERVTIQ